MKDVIDSGISVRHLLGNHLARIKRLDPSPTERDSTKVFRQRLIREYGSVCACCDRRRKVYAAHIVPLEVGGKTNVSNLVLLCKLCHDLYDDHGHWSIKRMSEIADNWRYRRPSEDNRASLRSAHTPAPTITLPPPAVRHVFDEVLKYQSKRWFVKAIELIDRSLLKIAMPPAAETYCRIKHAELTRRRAAEGVADQALCKLEGMNRRTVPKCYLPVYDYELGYVYRLVGNHKKAAAIFSRSAHEMRQAARSRLPGIDYVAACANSIHAELASLSAVSGREIAALLRRLRDLKSIASRHGAYWGGRWELNCASDEVFFHIKMGGSSHSWKALTRLRELYYEWDFATGWDKGALQSISELEGLVRVMFSRTRDDHKDGLGLLARAFVTRLGCRQRPEGIRDVGFVFAMGLRRINQASMSVTADAVERLMRNTRDGTSVLWPYVTATNAHGQPNNHMQRTV